MAKTYFLTGPSKKQKVHVMNHIVQWPFQETIGNERADGYLQSDIEHCAIAPQSVDIVFSNLAA